MMDARPPFLNGLLTAKNILLSLRQRKAAELKERGRRPLDQNNQEVPASHKKVQKKQFSEAIQVTPCERVPSRREQLTKSINEIGRQLHEMHRQTETYEVIFGQMAEHYLQSHKIVEENERCKRRSYQLEEQIREFKEKIQNNYQLIESCQREGAQIHAFMKESLQEFLKSERERAIVEPLPNKQPNTTHFLKEMHTISRPKQDVVAQEQGIGSSLSLNWRNLAQKTAKKAPVRKVKASQEMRESLFNSELYNI